MILKHLPTGNTGSFIETKEPIIQRPHYQTTIQLNDGRLYFAPSSEFIIIKG